MCNTSTYEVIVASKQPPKRRIRPPRPNPVGFYEKMDIVLSAVSDIYNVPISDILSNVRKREFVEPRQIAICLIIEHIEKIKLVTVGHRFNRNHATVIYSKHTAKDLIDTNRAIKYRYDKINERLISELNNEQTAA